MYHLGKYLPKTYYFIIISTLGHHFIKIIILETLNKPTKASQMQVKHNQIRLKKQLAN